MTHPPMQPATVRHAPPPPSHKRCVLLLVLMTLLFAGGATTLFYFGMKYKKQASESRRALLLEQQRLRSPEYRPGRRDLNFRAGLEYLEKAQRFAWVLKSAVDARSTAEEAAARFTEVLKASPDFFDARLGLARAQTLMYHYREACDNYEAALEIENDPLARYEVAVVYTLRFLRRRAALTADELKDDKQAETFRDRAHVHSKAFIDCGLMGAKAHVVTGIDMTWAGQCDEAFAQFQDGAALDPTQWAVYLFHAWAYVEKPDLVEAAKRLQQLTDRYPLLPEACALRARAFEESGLAESTLASWAEAVTLAPTFAEAYLAMGRKLTGDDARTAFEKAVEHDPTLKKYVESKKNGD